VFSFEAAAAVKGQFCKHGFGEDEAKAVNTDDKTEVSIFSTFTASEWASLRLGRTPRGPSQVDNCPE
jgi:hypothetical protein